MKALCRLDVSTFLDVQFAVVLSYSLDYAFTLLIVAFACVVV